VLGETRAPSVTGKVLGAGTWLAHLDHSQRGQSERLVGGNSDKFRRTDNECVDCKEH
jgi:hypothetical protein